VGEKKKKKKNAKKLYDHVAKGVLLPSLYNLKKPPDSTLNLNWSLP